MQEQIFITHKVKQGECLNSISSKFGHVPEKVWQYVGNKALRDLRKTPDVLFAGDVIKIPKIEVHKIDLATDRKHIFRRLGKTSLHVRIIIDNEDLSGEEYEICIDNYSKIGRFSADGKIDISIAPEANSGYLIMLGRRFDFELGSLDPINTTSGVQARLNQLGFPVGVVDNDYGEKTRESIKAFQAANNIEITGEMDFVTLDKLIQQYGA